MREDFPVDALSDSIIRAKAEELRFQLNKTDVPAPNIFQMLQQAKTISPELAGLEIVVLPDREMGNREAFAVFLKKPPRIFLSARFEQAARNNDPYARELLAHEVGHIVLHKGQEKFRIAGGNRDAGLSPEISAEHQANVFAYTLLMPDHLVASAKTAFELARVCGVEIETAAERIDAYRRDHRVGEPELDVNEAIRRLRNTASNRLKPTTRAPTAAEVRIKKQWDSLAVSVEHDMREYRLTKGGFLVRWSDQNNPRSHFGWMEFRGRIQAYLEINER